MGDGEDCGAWMRRRAASLSGVVGAVERGGGGKGKEREKLLSSVGIMGGVLGER
jgi:hypothetical protein